MQVLSNSLASKLVTTMWIHFHPYFKSRTVSDCSSVFKSQLEWFCPSQDKARNPRSISHHLAAHSTQFSAPSFKEDPVTLSSRRFSGIQSSFCPCLSVSDFYLQKRNLRPRHVCYLADSELCWRARCVQSVANRESFELWRRRCV